MNTSRKPRLLRWGFLWGFVALTSLLTLLINVFGFGQNWLSHYLLGGLINPTLLANMVLLTVVVGGYLLGIGRLSLRQLGVRLEQLPRALGFTFVLWLLGNLITASIGVLTDSLQWHPMWTQQGLLTILGWLVGQLFGNALYEEIAYRGFLLSYTVSLSLTAHRSRQQSQQRRFVFAVLTSQLLFALAHIPNRLIVDALPLGHALLSLLPLWLLGVLFAWSYWHTGNLLLVVGVHGLLNTPTLLVANAASTITSYLLLGLALLGIALYPLWFKRNNDRPTALETSTREHSEHTNPQDTNQNNGRAFGA
jgi:membrane protease YdiL (CAAX protease family)